MLFNDIDTRKTKALNLFAKELNLKNTKKLKDLFSVSQGIVPYAREELYKSMEKSIADNIVDSRLWHSDKQEDQFFKPELKGEDVTRYRVKWNEKQWVKYGNWLARRQLARLQGG